MITVQTNNFNTFSQVFYDNIVESLQLHQLSCSCGHSGCMRKYGRYERTVWFAGNAVKLKIQRVQCTHCGKTHAILLDVIVPYSRIPLEDQRKIILADNGGKACNHVLDKNWFIDIQMVHYIRRQYRQYWKQRLLSAGISLLEDLVQGCFRCYCRQFMQNRCAPNILFSPST